MKPGDGCAEGGTMNKVNPRKIILEDGSSYIGYGFGSLSEKKLELVKVVKQSSLLVVVELRVSFQFVELLFLLQ